MRNDTPSTPIHPEPGFQDTLTSSGRMRPGLSASTVVRLKETHAARGPAPLDTDGELGRDFLSELTAKALIMETKTKWKIGTAAVMVCVLLTVLLTEGVLIPKQLQPDVLPIRLLSVTTKENVRQAIYELRNQSGSKVDVWAPVTLNVGKPGDCESLQTQVTPLSIDDRQAATIAVIVPHDKAWQVQIRVARHGARKGTVVISEWSTDSQQ